MNKDFVPYSEAKEMNKLGYSEESYGWYTTEGELDTVSLCFDQHATLAPLWQQAFEWFEVNHGMYVTRNILATANEFLDVRYFIIAVGLSCEVTFEEDYDEFERYKSRVGCIRKLIEIVKNEKTV